MHTIFLLVALGHLPLTVLAEPMRADRMNIQVTLDQPACWGPWGKNKSYFGKSDDC